MQLLNNTIFYAIIDLLHKVYAKNRAGWVIDL